MKLNLYALAMSTLLLVNSANPLPPAPPTLFDEIEHDGHVFFRKTNFLTPYMLSLKFTQEEEVMIQRVLNLYKVSHNALVDLRYPDANIAAAGEVTLSSCDEVVPYITLSPAWQKLPTKAKEFVLAHELAHVVLRHGQINPGEHIANIYKTFGLNAVLTAAFVGLYGIAASPAWYFKEIKKTSTKIDRLVFKSFVLGLFTGTYAFSALSLKSSQSREKEADIMAANILGSAEGGILFFNELLKKENIALVACADFGIDVLGLSSHPSHHARIRHLQEWQAEQGKR